MRVVEEDGDLGPFAGYQFTQENRENWENFMLYGEGGHIGLRGHIMKNAKLRMKP